MPQQNLIAARRFLHTLDECRKLRNAWSIPHECIVFRIHPDRVKEWEAACGPAAKRAKSIIEELTLLAPAVVRLVHACGEDSKLVLERTKEEIELLDDGPWNHACNENVFIHEPPSAIDKVRLAIEHAIMLAEQSAGETPAVLKPASTESRGKTDSGLLPPVSGYSEGDLITITQAATLSALSEGLISRAATDGEIETNGVRHKGRRLHAGSFMRWLNARKQEQTARENAAGMKLMDEDRKKRLKAAKKQ